MSSSNFSNIPFEIDIKCDLIDKKAKKKFFNFNVYVVYSLHNIFNFVKCDVSIPLLPGKQYWTLNEVEKNPDFTLGQRNKRSIVKDIVRVSSRNLNYRLEWTIEILHNN